MVISLDGFPAYALNDPRLPIPTLRKLAREGAAATAMQPINPTVTWPNHTTMVTGVDASHHQVLFNGLLTRNQADHSIAIEPWRNKDLLVHAETVYDVAYHAGLTTAQVDWVAIYGARTITWSFAEQPDPNGLIETELIKAGVVTKDQLAKFDDSSPAWQDEIRTDAAVEILKRHKPNLLLVHLLCLDDINHQYGPMSDASLEAMAFLDDRVKQISDTLTSTHQPFTLLIVSDHGFRKTNHAIYPNTLLRQQGLAKDAWVVPDGGVAMVYVTDPSRRAELLPRLSHPLRQCGRSRSRLCAGGFREAGTTHAGAEQPGAGPAHRCQARKRLRQWCARRKGRSKRRHARIPEQRSADAGDLHGLGKWHQTRSAPGHDLQPRCSARPLPRCWESN